MLREGSGRRAKKREKKRKKEKNEKRKKKTPQHFDEGGGALFTHDEKKRPLIYTTFTATEVTELLNRTERISVYILTTVRANSKRLFNDLQYKMLLQRVAHIVCTL